MRGITQRSLPALLGVVLGWLAPTAAVRAHDDHRVWVGGEAAVFKHDAWRGALGYLAYLQERPYDLNAYEISPRLRYQATPWLDTAANGTFYRSRSAATGRWLDTQRLELDLVPFTTTARRVKLQLLNRYELLWVEGRAGDGVFPRYRLFPKADWAAHWLPGMTGAGVGNESYYDFRAGRWTENRCYPLRLTFGAGAHANWGLYYMINSKRPLQGAGTWTHSHVLGITLNFDLTR